MPYPLVPVVEDFRKGYDAETGHYRPEGMAPGSSPALQNFIVRSGSIVTRKGLARLNAHPIGFVQAATFEVGEAWSDSPTNDGVIFKQGVNSKKYEITGSNVTTDLAVSLNLYASGLGADRVCFWFYAYDTIVTAEPKSTSYVKELRIRLYSSYPTIYFEYFIYQDSTTGVVWPAGWNFVSIKKEDFTSVGSPNWASIVRLEFRALKNLSVTADPFFNLDDMYVERADSNINNIIDYIKKDGSQKVLASANTGIYESISSHTDWTAIITGLTDNLRLGWIVFSDHLIAGNGTDDNFKYKTAQTKLGIAAPPSAATFNSNINGTMESGQYYYKYVYVNSNTGHKSNPSPASALMSPSTDPNDGIRVNIPANGGVDTQVDKVHVFRTFKDAPVTASYYRVPGEIVYTGSATTFDDTYPDSLLADEALEYDHDVPPKFTMASHDGGFVYYAGDPNNRSRLWRSKLYDPESVPVTSYVDCGPDDGDTIRAIKTMPDGSQLVFKRNSKYHVTDYGGIGMIARQVNNRGTYNQESAVVLPEGVVYGSDDGVWLWNGNADRNLGDPLRYDIETGLASIAPINGIIGYDQIKKVVRYEVTMLGATTNNREYAFDIREGTWSYHTKELSALGKVVLAGNPVDCAGTYRGYLLKNEDSSSGSDDGVVISAIAYTRFHDIGRPDRIKKFRKLILWLTATGNWNLEVEFAKSFSASEGDKTTVNLSSGSLWDSFVWGVDKWGAEDILRVEVVIPPSVRYAAGLQLRFKNSNINQPVEIKQYCIFAQVMHRRVV